MRRFFQDPDGSSRRDSNNSNNSNDRDGLNRQKIDFAEDGDLNINKSNAMQNQADFTNQLKETAQNKQTRLKAEVTAKNKALQKARNSEKSNSILLQQKEIDYLWQARDINGRKVSGEIRAVNEEEALKTLKKKQLTGITLQKLRVVRPKKITKKDVTYFTRQLSILLKAGLPLLQSMDVVAQGHENPTFSKLIEDIKLNVQAGSSLSQALRSHPRYFDELYCNLIEAGEATGILDSLLERLAIYKEKQLSLQAKIKNAMIYPSVILIVVFIVVAIIMIYVIPTFKEIFASVGASLPVPTLIVMSISDFFVKFWYLIMGVPIVALLLYRRSIKRSEKMHDWHDNMILKIPVFGDIFRKAAIARWSRTFSTMFGAGVPIIDSLESVAGSAGNTKYAQGTKFIQKEVSKGSGLTTAMRQTMLFPNMVTQMVASGEESGALDRMLDKVGDFYEEEVDNKVQALSTILEPIIIVFLGVLICVILVAMYLPLFKLGEAF